MRSQSPRWRGIGSLARYRPPAQAAQMAILRFLEDTFEELDLEEASEGREVVPNLWNRSVGDRLLEQARILQTELRSLCNDPCRLFDLEKSAEHINTMHEKAIHVNELPSDSTPFSCWQSLLKLVEEVHKIVFESYLWKKGHDGTSKEFNIAISQHLKKAPRPPEHNQVLLTLNDMRNAGAHAYDSAREDSARSWNAVLTWASRRLGRDKPPRLEPNNPVHTSPYNIFPLEAVRGRRSWHTRYSPRRATTCGTSQRLF